MKNIRRYLILALVAVLPLALFACSTRLAIQDRATGTATNKIAWLSDGSIALSRPLPEVSLPGDTHLLGFLPVAATHSGTWLTIDRSKKTLELMKGEEMVLSTSAEGLERVKPGSYKIIHKQTRPVWYAPDSYFSARKLPIPSASDASRFRRGALGDFVLIFNRESPIHNGPVWSDDVGGIRLGDNDIAKVYYSLDVDSVVEVR